MKYNETSINKMYGLGRGILRDIKAQTNKLGHGHITPKSVDHANAMLSHIEKLKSLTTEHYKGRNKARYEGRFKRERESCLAELWKMYEAVQNYIDNGTFLDGSQEGTIEFTPDLEDHLVRSRNHRISCGTFYRSTAARVKPVTKIQVSGQSVPHPTPRSESRAVYKMCSKIDTVNGGRQVLGYGNTNTKQWEDS